MLKKSDFVSYVEERLDSHDATVRVGAHVVRTMTLSGERQRRARVSASEAAVAQLSREVWHTLYGDVADDLRQIKGFVMTDDKRGALEAIVALGQKLRGE